MVVLPHAGRVPLWATALFLALALWRLAELAGRATPPGRAVRLALALAVAVGVYASYGQVFGRNPGVALLVAFSGLKLVETHSRRDAFVGVLLGYFLVVTNLLYTQSIPTGGSDDCVKSARSITVSGSKSVRSASMPSAIAPFFDSPKRRAGRTVIFLSASSKEICRRSRT